MYRIFLILAFPFLVVYVLVRSLRDRRYLRTLAERFGTLPPSFQRTLPGAIWLHAVSVGEVLSAVELVKRLRTVFPDTAIFLSTTTLGGREAAQARVSALVEGIFYSPIDYVWIVRRILRRLRPSVVVIMETEIWPNLFREVRRSGAGLVVVNGRISDKALPSYQRWRSFFRYVLQLPSMILVQSDEQRRRYLTVGAPQHLVRVSGNLKHDFDPESAKLTPALERWLSSGSDPLWVAASTVAPEFAGDCDEDDAVISAWLSIRKNRALRLLIAPRKPERFDVVANKLAKAGISFARRSTLPASHMADVLLLDSIGELAAVFRYADVVFMGGTLAHRGGHNLLEPAAFGKPIVAGTHLENFAEIQKLLSAGRGYLEIHSADDLAGAITRLLGSDGAVFGGRALELASTARGATVRAVDAVDEASRRAVPRLLNTPVSTLCWMWVLGGYVKRAITHVSLLPAPVVSVGGLAMGGAGKTPIVREIARRLAADGKQVAILTRGYRRQTREAATILPRGREAPVLLTGDEAQIFVRDGTAHVGIGNDRADVGRQLTEKAGRPDVFVLDDGFQHARVARDLDIVVLDGTDPFAGGAPFPLGRLREPLSALTRASLIVITRPQRNTDAIVRRIQEHNHKAPVVIARKVPKRFVEITSRREHQADFLSGHVVTAFCGLGNPESFRSTLMSLGVDVRTFLTFADHHRYSTADLCSMPEGLTLVTTEKDAVKLEGILHRECWYLEIGLEFDPADVFWRAVESVIE